MELLIKRIDKVETSPQYVASYLSYESHFDAISKRGLKEWDRQLPEVPVVNSPNFHIRLIIWNNKDQGYHVKLFRKNYSLYLNKAYKDTVCLNNAQYFIIL